MTAQQIIDLALSFAPEDRAPQGRKLNPSGTAPGFLIGSLPSGLHWESRRHRARVRFDRWNSGARPAAPRILSAHRDIQIRRARPDRAHEDAVLAGTKTTVPAFKITGCSGSSIAGSLQMSRQASKHSTVEAGVFAS